MDAPVEGRVASRGGSLTIRKHVVSAAVCAGVIIGLITIAGAGGAQAGTARPSAAYPAAGQRVSSLPYFRWSAVPGADHYEFALAADSAFNSPVLGSDGHFTSLTTRATISSTLTNGTYWWHVRAITKSGTPSSWSVPRRLVMAWTAAPSLVSPRNGGAVSFPAPLLFSWRPVAGAVKYQLAIGTDAALGSLLGGRPVETSATDLAPAVTLHVGTYYWAVTPVDAEGNKGTRSKIRSFRWAWPAVATNLHVQDLVGPADVTDPTFGSAFDAALFLPQFSWNAVPGATRYEVEINSDESWATGSRVCCSDKILAPVFTPTKPLISNRYYWRVRAFDANGNAGAWAPAGNGTAANSFVQGFDNVCSSELPANCVPAPGPSIRNLRVEDWSGAGVTGGSTSGPIVLWDPVPGASSYTYEVTRFHDGACDYTWPKDDHWRGSTATAAWTPLGKSPGTRPYPANVGVTSDSHALVAGAQYCLRVRAEITNDIFGDFTSIPGVAFTYSGATGGVVGALGAGDYLTPAGSQPLRQMPVFRWRPVAGATSYWVLVAKDPSFTNVIDYAYTFAPVYAPRTGSGTKTYADETTTYYWVALPAKGSRGSGVSGDPVSAAHGSFQKQVPPTELGVTLQQPQVVFHWRPVAGAAQYELEVSTDPNYGSVVDRAKTSSTSYTADATYPPAKKLYWRVRADDVERVGLSWAQSSFQYRLAVPRLARNARSGDVIPTWRWHAVPGASSYDIHVDLPNGSDRDFSGILTPAVTATKMTGTGIFRWQVRANFPNSSGKTHGPYSRLQTFARSIKPPQGARIIGGSLLVFSWRPKAGAKEYKVQISSKPDFSSTVERETTENPIYAPKLSSSSYKKGGRFYWHVSAVDADGNSGDYTKTGVFTLRARAR